MGGTAIGTGLNAAPGFPRICAEKLSELTGMEFVAGVDLVEATPDTGAYVSYSSALKRLAVKLSKICNDLRLLASGPRCGLNEINLPPMAPGSSIMPGKVNPVIPEVTNQTCFKVIGNDTTVMIAAEAGQLQLNVMEPIITECLIEDLTWLPNAMDTLREKCIDGITVNKDRVRGRGDPAGSALNSGGRGHRTLSFPLRASPSRPGRMSPEARCSKLWSCQVSFTTLP